MIKLDCSNYFSYFIFNYDSQELSETDQKIAKLSTCILGLFTIGLALLVVKVFFYDDKHKVNLEKNTQIFQDNINIGQKPKTPVIAENKNREQLGNNTKELSKGLESCTSIILEHEELNEILEFSMPNIFEMSKYIQDKVKTKSQTVQEKIELLFFVYKHRKEILNIYEEDEFRIASSNFWKFQKQYIQSPLPIITQKDRVEGDTLSLSDKDLENLAYRTLALRPIADFYEMIKQDETCLDQLFDKIEQTACYTELNEALLKWKQEIEARSYKGQGLDQDELNMIKKAQRYHLDAPWQQAVDSLLYSYMEDWFNEYESGSTTSYPTKETALTLINSEISGIHFKNGITNKGEIQEQINKGWDKTWSFWEPL